jgi:ABC-type multidrug transport system ATPase subunit
VKFPIIAEGLTKKFGSFTAANGISFKVKKGEIFGLLGPNGAGKSTTFKMLCGLEKPTEGRAFVNGILLQERLSEARLHIGYMAQKFSLYGNLTVRQNLELFGSLYCVSPEKKKKRIAAMIATFSLEPYLDQICDVAPIGFKQRLSFAAATLHSPQVLFLDEPTSGMDPVSRQIFWQQIKLLAEHGCTIMVTTHFLEEAEYCDRIALLYQSKIIYLGTHQELKNKVRSPELPNPTLDDAFVAFIRGKT